ncbi:hypothetical protein VitviT2T_028177 [Vitis vinifera]|uniref:Uncharacterized protein n=1 Tax=Vitis vinifera TaxID=29760 RepID=A0ABY9DT70_VITVI|nr:hypothetical protein VitviT2T_028177 [Vitis vinifera]
MTNSRLWKTSTTLSRELKALDAMNSSGLWMTSTTLGHDNKALDAMNRTLASVLVFSLDGIVSSTRALSWSYGL